ncbi:MAG: ATP-binding cassette domain-containing protein, partial [Bacilli bacterium]|nr:ATP-binding cassette domain-containing protein [Bacilli bacterium]
KIEAKKALEDVGLGKQAKKKASKLSGGERQRVAIARSLALKTKIIIFDEPTGNLDPSTAKEIIALINRLKDNRLIVYVTHDYPLVEEYATRHIVLSDNHVESDEIIKEGENVGEAMNQLEPKMRFGSYFYIGQAFTFSRLSRLVSTCAVLLSGALFAFGVASLATMAFVSTDITSNYVDMNHKTYISYPCGNLAQVKKSDTTAEEPYLADFAEGDFVRDNGGVVLYQNFYLVRDYDYTTTFQNLSSTVRTYRYSNYLGRGTEFRIGNLLPEGADLKTKQSWLSDEEIISSGYIPAAIVAYDSGSFITSSLGQSINQNYMSPVDAFARLVIPTAFYSSMATNRLTEEGQAYFLSAPKIFVNKLYLTKDDSFKGENVRLVVSNENMQAIRDFVAEGYLLDSSFRLVNNGHPITFGHSLAMELVNSSPVATYQGEEYPIVNSGTLNILRMPQALEGHLDEVYINGVDVRIPVADLIAKMELGVSYYTGSLPLNDFGKRVYVSGSHIAQYLIKYGGFDAFFGKDKATTQALVKKAAEGGSSAVYFPSEKTTRERFEIVDFSKLPLWYRVAAIGVIFAAVLLMLVLGLILRNILARYYFRQAGDQNVLTWVGYGNRDMFVVNLLPSLIIELCAILLVYPLGLALIEGFGIMFSLFPTFYILSVIAAMLFAVLTSLPLKKKGGVRHD